MRFLNRRQFMKMAGGLAAGAALAGCGPSDLLRLQAELLSPQPELETWPGQPSGPSWRLLNRITFGPRASERLHMAEIGPAAFVEEQLAPDTLPAMAIQPRLTLRRLESLQLDSANRFDVDREIVLRELQQATLLRAVYSPGQLYEVMVEFWSNHFNIDQNKEACAWLKPSDDRDAIRPNALGNFYELLYASAHSPAMLVYLDNQENHAGNPNENYARELMELHTLGVDGGYTQNDVQELARCFTGWTVKEHFYRGQFTFNADNHDDGAKQIMGMTIPAGARQAGGKRVIDMLAGHPATAHFISTKLVRRFVADEPPPKLVARAARTFIDSQGDIKAVLRTILLSPQFLSQSTAPARFKPARHLKLKRPFEYIVSTLRQLNAATDAGPALLDYLAEMGQPLFQWPTPDGFPDQTEAWQGTLLTRWRFALAIAHHNIAGTRLNFAELIDPAAAQTTAIQLNQLAIRLLGQPMPDDITDRLLQLNSGNKTLLAALIASPAFQWR